MQLRSSSVNILPLLVAGDKDRLSVPVSTLITPTSNVSDRRMSIVPSLRPILENKKQPSI